MSQQIPINMFGHSVFHNLEQDARFRNASAARRRGLTAFERMVAKQTVTVAVGLSPWLVTCLHAGAGFF